MSSYFDLPPLSGGVEARVNPPEPLAIVGIGCRLPGGASSTDLLWQLLIGARDAISEAPPERWSNRRFHDRDATVPGRMQTSQGGFLQEPIDQFDAGFFGFSAREAEQIDPQQRLLLETAWEALEGAGQDVARLRGTRTGVFVGGFCTDALLQRLVPDNRHLIDAFTATGVTLAMLANRLSHVFDFRGPSLSLDTACSSSLVAVHLACASLWRGECTMALAGGSNVMLRPEYSIAMSKGGFLSSFGRCLTFDERAAGYVRSEGAAVVVLKPLNRAVAERDPIWAVIRGSGVNQDGGTPTITQPSAHAQEALMREVYAAAGVAPGALAYVEAHGTGTQAGDSIEAQALQQVLRVGRDALAPCWVGSIKSNLGHLEAAAGVAGLIKAALVLRHRQIPPNLHFQRPNPKIDLVQGCLRVPTTVQPLPVDIAGCAFAAVNSFGYGGTNAHVLLATPPEPSILPAATETPGSTLFPLSAADPAALQALAAQVAHRLESSDRSAGWGDFAHTAVYRRSHLRHRVAVVASDKVGAAERLRAFARGESSHLWVSGEAISPPERLGFVFTGMGPQVWGMGRDAYATEPVFRQAFDRVAHTFATRAALDVAQVFGGLPAGGPIMDTVMAQAANFALQVALAELWQSWGIVPSALVGHSTGEIAAAHVSGVLTLEDAVDVCHHRARFQRRLQGAGGMLAVGLSETAVAAYLNPEPEICIAAINAPESVTLAGPVDALERVEAVLPAAVFHRRLNVDIPYHGTAMRALAADIKEVLRSLRPRPAVLPLYSSVIGAIVGADLALGAEYWVRNVVEPVRFAEACRAMVVDDVRLLLQVGPHPVLAESLQQNLAAAGAGGATFASLRRDVPDSEQLRRALAALYTRGHVVAWDKVVMPAGRCVPFPAYPWQRRSLWLESKRGREDRTGRARHPFVDYRRASPRPAWEIDTGRGYLPYLADHRIGATVVFPGAAYLEAALVAHEEVFGSVPCVLEGLRFQRMLALELGRPAVLLTEYDPAERRWQAHALLDRESGEWSTHADATLHHLIEPPNLKTLGQLRLANARRCSPATVYRDLDRMGLHYGAWFRTIRSIEFTTHEAVVRLRGHPQLAGARFDLAHPTLVDGALQAIVTLTSAAGSRVPYLPAAIKRVVCHGRLRRDSVAHVRITDTAPGRLYAEVQLADLNGTVALELLGIELRALGDTGAVDPADGHYLPGWREASLVTAQPSGTCWLTGGAPEVRAALAECLRAAGWNLVDSFPALPPGGLAVVWGEPAPRDTFATALAATADLMALIQQGATRPDVRWLLATPGCHIVTGREPRTSLTHLGWTGFARALLNEGLARSCRIVDLDPAALESAAAVVVAEARAEGGDREVAWRQRQRFRLEWRRASLALRGGTVRVSLQSTYLVTGGTRGFGLEIARWLLSEGAGRVVLASRSGVNAPGLRAALDGLGEAASRIEVVKGDIADETFVGPLARRLACDVLPLRGVFHCAVVLEDGLISSQNPERLRRVFWPKVGGALALHRSTQEVPLDWFVCLSSISSVFGNPGQSTYAAANAFLEGLVSYRRRHGLAGTVINFGLIRDTGVARGRSDLEAKLERFGIGALGTDDALRGLCAALNARIPQLGVFRVDWDRWRRAFPGAAADRRFDPIINLTAGDLAVERGALAQQLQLLDPEQRVEGVVTVLRSHLASGLRTPIEQLVDTANILELGVDSLGMIELVTTINRIFAVQLTSTELLGHPTLHGLALLILGKLGYSSSDLAVLDNRRAYQ